MLTDVVEINFIIIYYYYWLVITIAECQLTIF